MKSKLFCCFFILLSVLLIISCEDKAPPVPTVGTITGRVVYSSSDNKSVSVTIEKSDGVSTDGKIYRQTRANVDGSYEFINVPVGNYSVYASSDDSVQKAVCTDIIVEAGRSVSVKDLALTPTGSIQGKIRLDNNSSGNIGFIVFIEGTSYKAVTADDGSFKISGIPSGNGYRLFVMKGEKVSLVAASVGVPEASSEDIGSVSVDSSILTHGIIWKGSLPSYPANPSLYWAYYNTNDGNSYIYNGTSWDILAKAGSTGPQGEKGDTGTSISWLGSFEEHPSSTVLYAAYYNTTDGNSYIFDGSSWTILASKGGQGDKGEQGETGATGSDGAAGLDGKPIVWKGSLTSAPENAVELWAYYNTTDGNSYIYNGSSWDILAKAGATGPQGDKGDTGTSITWLGSFAGHPTSTTLYAAYYNTTDGNSYIFDGSSWTILASKGGQGNQGDQGVQGLPGLDGKNLVWKGSLSSAPENAEELWAYYNTTDGNSYIYNGTSWDILAKAGSTGPQGEKGDTGTSISWLGSFEEHPSSTVLYAAYYNTNDGNSYIFDGGAWTILASKGGQGIQGEQGPNGFDGLDGTSIMWKGSLSVAPENAEELWAYYNTTDGSSYIFDGNKWTILASNGKSIVWLGSLSTIPSNPNLYDAYYNTITGNSYIWNGSSWDLLASKGDQGDVGPQGPVGEQGTSIVWKGSFASFSDINSPLELWAFYNTSDGCSYIYSGGKWNLLASHSDEDKARTMIIGKVVLEGSLSASKVDVSAVNISDPTLILKTYTNSSGEFTFSNLEEGDYLVSVEKSGYATYTSDTLSVVSGKVANAGTLEISLLKGRITGRITLEGMADCSGILVSVLGTDYSSSTDADGFFSLQIPSGTYTGGIRLTRKNYESVLITESVAVSTATSYSIGELQLKSTGVDYLEGKIQIAGLADLSGIEVRVDGDESFSTVTDSLGCFRFEDIPLGTFELTASSERISEYTQTVNILPSSGILLKRINLNLVVIRKPSFSQIEGNYYNNVSVSITAEDGTKIYYTTDGTAPDNSSSVYSGPIEIEQGTTIKAVAVNNRNQRSEVAEATYGFSVAPVLINTASGTYKEAVDVILNTETEGAQIYYTIDGSAPSAGKNLYSGPIHVSSDSVIKAIAIKEGYTSSNVNQAEYNFIFPEKPVLSLSAGVYNDGQALTLKCDTGGALIYYTTDGNAPTKDSLIYSSDIVLNRNMKVRAISIKNGLASEECSAQYSVKASAPVSSIDQGTYQNRISIQLMSSTADSVIRYTIDGSTPSLNSAVYTEPLLISRNTVVKAVTFKDGLLSSNTSSYSYVIDNQSSSIVVKDPELIEVDIKLPEGWYSGIAVTNGTSEYLEAVLSKNILDADYSWYIDGKFMSVSKSICLASFSDELSPGSHIIRIEVEVNGQLLMENFLLKIE